MPGPEVSWARFSLVIEGGLADDLSSEELIEGDRRREVAEFEGA